MTMRHGDLTDEMARFAAKWWADQLRGTAKLDNGDRTGYSDTAHLIAKMGQRRVKRSPEDVNRFEEILYKKLLEYTSPWVSVDYHPCPILYDSAQEAECDIIFGLPWKTQMFFMFDESIMVSLGYGGSRKTVLESPDRAGYGFGLFWKMTERKWWEDEQ